MTTPRQGWRHFRCDETGDDGLPCGHQWREATRDCYSPSGVDCPVCGGWTFPHESELDTTLPVDDSGNLLPL